MCVFVHFVSFSFLVKYIDVLCFIVDLFRVFQQFGHFMQIFSVFFILFYYNFLFGPVKGKGMS